MSQAISSVAQRLPEWDRLSGRVFDDVRDNPMLASNDSNVIAHLLASTYERIHQADEGRTMKVNAQTLSGSSGRLPALSGDDTEWARIVAAGKRTAYYGDS